MLALISSCGCAEIQFSPLIGYLSNLCLITNYPNVCPLDQANSFLLHLLQKTRDDLLLFYLYFHFNLVIYVDGWQGKMKCFMSSLMVMFDFSNKTILLSVMNIAFCNNFCGIVLKIVPTNLVKFLNTFVKLQVILKTFQKYFVLNWPISFS